MNDEERIRIEEAEYDMVAPYVPEDERIRVANLREEREAGDKYNSYGHDLFAAMRRGWRNKARANIKEAGDFMVKSGWIDGPRSRLAALLYVLVEQAGSEGATEDEVRRTLQRMLDADDSSRKANRVRLMQIVKTTCDRELLRGHWHVAGRHIPRGVVFPIGLIILAAGGLLTLFDLHHIHHFPGLHAYGGHLYFEAIADAGGFYASTFCKHWYHRVPIAIGFALVSTYALVTLVG